MTPIIRTISFRHWLKTQPLSKLPHGPQGDFVRAARTDRRLPDVQSWSELKSYLYDQHACREALLAAAGVWRHYSRKVAA
jgi:hypothetical protein